jgi:predicted nuclease with TOPRIM domain
MPRPDELQMALNDVLKTIQDGLKKNYSPVFSSEYQKILKKAGLDKKREEIEYLEEEEEKIREKLKIARQELSQLDGRIYRQELFSGEEKQNLNYLLDFLPNNAGADMTNLKGKAVEQTSDCIEAKNIIAYKLLERDVLRTYRLAVTKKEKRAIILQLQTRDWTSIGIDLPDFSHFQDFKVVDGTISLSEKRALPKPVKEI